MLYAHADRYAEEISTLLKTKITKRIPVYLIAKNQLLNAYFSVLPYNHIVLYDSGIFDSQLSNLKDNILMVFYHELTHAISLNIRSPFWQGMSSVFGDALSPNMLWSMPLSFIEGVTVSFESRRDMQGRLNDPLVHHFFSQNKIEKKSPSWQEAASSKNIYPYAKWSYLYGGAFSLYLQEKYGMENYARLWHRGGRFGFFRDFTIRQKFKKIYATSLDSAWQDFLSALTIPKKVVVNANRIDKAKKKEKKLYKTMTTCKDYLVWKDSEKHAVFVQKTDSLKESKTKKLFDADSYLHRLSCSQDGNLLLVSTMRSLASHPQNIVRVFDMQKKKFLREVYKSVRDAGFANSKAIEKDSSKYARYIVGIRQESQKMELVLIDRFSFYYNKKSKNKKPYKEKILLTAGEGESFASLYNPSFVGKGQIAVIAANGMQRKILLIDAFAKQPLENLVILPLPKNVQAMRYLQSVFTSQGWMLTFSFVPSLEDLGNHFYRLAVYNRQSKQLSLQQQDFSGGVFSAVAQKNNIYYIARFAHSDAILELPKDAIKKNILSVPIAFSLPKPSKEVSLTTKDFSTKEKSYRSALWLVDGLFLPFVRLPLNNITKYNYFAPAFIYITADPTERFRLMLLPAVFYVKPFFADISASFSYHFRANFIFTTIVQDSMANGFESNNAFRKSGISARLSFITALDVSWRKLIFEVASGFHGYTANVHNSINPYKAPYADNFAYIHAATSFAMFKKSHFKRRLFLGESKRGLQLTLESYTPINTKIKTTSTLLQSMGDFFLPVLPLRMGLSFAWAKNMFLNSQGYFFGGTHLYQAKTKHMPILPEYQNASYAYKSSYSLVGFDIELFLLTWNIGKVVPGIVLSFHDFFIRIGYRSNWLPLKKIYFDSIYMRANINTSLLSGLHAVPFDITFEYAYPLRQRSGFQSKGNFRVFLAQMF